VVDSKKGQVKQESKLPCFRRHNKQQHSNVLINEYFLINQDDYFLINQDDYFLTNQDASSNLIHSVAVILPLAVGSGGSSKPRVALMLFE
jgi:hypothetical protein